MKNFTSISTLFLLLLSLAQLSALSSCEREELLTDAPDLQPLEGQAGRDMFPSDPCSGSVYFTANYSVISAANYPGYDFAVQISHGSLELPNRDCFCATMQYCVTVTFPQSSVSLTSLATSPDEVIELTMDGEGGYVGHNSNIYTAPTPIYGTIQVEPQEHTVCVTGSSVALFRFPNGFPSGFDPTTAVIKVTGLCIVDNLPDPHE